MKKLTSLLVAGITILAISGCDDIDTPTEITSVNLTDLENGYKITGTGFIGESEIDAILFCGIDYPNSLTYWTNYPVNWGEFTIEGVNDHQVCQDDIYECINTEDDQTPGVLQVDVTYHAEEFGGDDGWTITSIEEVADCQAVMNEVIND